MPISHFKTTNITTDNMELNMDITTKELISAGNENSTYAYHTDSDLDLQKNAAGQPRGGYLDEQDGVYFFGNQSDFTLDHKPGDSLFVITTEIENKDVVLKVFQEDLVQSVRDKIMERMIYFPGGGNSLILKEFRWINVNRVKLTFWLQLNQGGKGMIHFLKSQLKALENYPFGSSSATLISFTVEDVNECHLGIHKCHINAVCDNRIGSYSCTCMDGYEDHSATVAGTICIYSKLAEIHSLSEHMEILIGAIVTVAVTLLLIIIILCVVKHKRQVKVDFSLQDPSIIEHGAHLGGDRHGKFGQPLSSQARHLPPRHGREHHTARDTASTLELTRITVEQASC
ncbi:uncharacterized protein LOC130360846 isoform X1 [Hyla sarda]|uniref:uncharacterized protein LOC130360846 isoform X1 n=1 Tax=Hyla sarda TaxID=327740 RepID=UPI0024C39980|nr:uncharacterized protein LOC130360846 isoform X1 [Hyla sarda]